jgi:hypothetical protein
MKKNTTIRNLRFTVPAIICSLLIISLYSIDSKAQQEESLPWLLSSYNYPEEEGIENNIQVTKYPDASGKPESRKLMIPRVTKPWSEAMLFVGNGKTLYSDFTFIKDKKGRWHTMGCFGIEPDGVGNGWAISDGYSMFHAVGSSLDQPMKLLPKIYPQIKTPKQAIMWAPGAIWNKDSTTAYMYYFHHYGWEWEGEVAKAQILPQEGCARLLVSNSDDLETWKPYDGGELEEQNMIFREIDDRDFCVFWDERIGKYLLYYCSSLSSGSKVRTSDDLIHWSAPKTILTEPAGDPHGYSESPFVLYRDGYYYLWVSGIDYSHTSLYISEDPFNFGDAITSKIEDTPGHAPEIVSEKGVDYMACSMVSTYPSKFPSDHDLEGIYIQKLKWENAEKGMEKRITRKTR